MSTQRSFSFERLIRKLFPSTSKLTFNPLFKFLVDASDLPGKLVFPGFRKLPPNHLRIRVGVGNEVFNNQLRYLVEPNNFWIELLAAKRIDLNSTIIDIGSGCGRTAHILRDYSSISDRFNGSYVGIDIDAEMIAWCNSHFDSRRFRFLLSTDGSKSYNRAGLDDEPYRIPEPDGIAHLVFSNSLFTHLLEPQARNYIKESFRLLRPGGSIHHSVFCIDYPPPAVGSRYTFSHRIGNAIVESLAQPEAAVAYTEAFLLSLVSEAGFVDAKIVHEPGTWQPRLVAWKPSIDMPANNTDN
jgi:SAM-dependent methyltransferase